MVFNPFGKPGGVVAGGSSHPPVVDKETILIYNALMARYYEVGRDFKMGHISNATAEHQLRDIKNQAQNAERNTKDLKVKIDLKNLVQLINRFLTDKLAVSV